MVVVSMPFDPGLADRNAAAVWERKPQFGMERHPKHVYLEQVVPDRYGLERGLKLVNTYALFAPAPFGADFSQPAVLTTLAHTNCVDRVCKAGTSEVYRRTVAQRYALHSKEGQPLIEEGFPIGGGSEEPGMLAHVTVAHAATESIRRILAQHPHSFFLYNVDIQTHVGRMDDPIRYGRHQESAFVPDMRAACGAIAAALTHYNDRNPVHRRIREDLGEENYGLLCSEGVRTADGTDISMVVAPAIVAIRGLQQIMRALPGEMGERGVGHITASVVVNRTDLDDPVIYLARGTVMDHNRQRQVQGLGLDAGKYAGRFVDHTGERRLLLAYDGMELSDFPVETEDF